MDSNKIVMILAFIIRGKSKTYLDMLESANIKLHQQMVGQGTAPSEMMNIFGFGSSDKDVMISFAAKRSADRLMEKFSEALEKTPRLGGIVMTIPLSAINRLTSEIINRADRESVLKGEEKMENETKHKLILISVNSGYADEVMQCARRVGATGGTVLRARLAGSETLEMFERREIQEEKEIISILATESMAATIMTEINTQFGLKSEASGVVCAVPVDNAFKI